MTGQGGSCDQRRGGAGQAGGRDWGLGGHGPSMALWDSPMRHGGGGWGAFEPRQCSWQGECWYAEVAEGGTPRVVAGSAAGPTPLGPLHPRKLTCMERSLPQVAGESLVFQGAPLLLEPRLSYVARKEGERSTRLEPATQVREGACERPPPGVGGTKRPREAEAAAPEPAAAAGAEDFTPGCCVRFDFGPDPGFVEQPSFGLVKDSFGGKEAGLKYADYAAVRAAPVNRCRLGSTRAERAPARAHGLQRGGLPCDALRLRHDRILRCRLRKYWPSPNPSPTCALPRHRAPPLVWPVLGSQSRHVTP